MGWDIWCSTKLVFIIIYLGFLYQLMKKHPPVLCLVGCLRGQLLEPFYFNYMLPWRHLIHQFGCVFYHCYANDIQLYLSFRASSHSNLTTLHKCLAEISNWMSHFLQLNLSKSEVLVFEPDQVSTNIFQHLDSLATNREIVFQRPRHHFWLPSEIW